MYWSLFNYPMMDMINKKTIELKKQSIWVTFQMEGIHNYPDAPDEVAFLRHPHRHMFHFKVEIEVFHDDRDLEFIVLKRDILLQYNCDLLQLDNKSCEMIAKDLYAFLSTEYPGRAITIEVSEDGENGAKLEWS